MNDSKVVLILGASSTLGLTIAAEFARSRSTVVCMSRREESSRLLPALNIEWHKHDLTQTENLVLEKRVDYVINCASGRPADSVADLENSGVLAVDSLIKRLVFSENAAWIQISSHSAHLIEQNGPRIHDAKSQDVAYAQSKLAIDSFLIREQQTVTSVHSLRIPALAYPGTAQHLLQRWTNLAKRNLPIEITSWEHPYNHVVKANDVAKFVLKLTHLHEHSPMKVREAYSLASSHPISIGEVASTIVGNFRSNSRIVNRGLSAPPSVVDDNYARSNYGYKSGNVRSAIAKFLSLVQ